MCGIKGDSAAWPTHWCTCIPMYMHMCTCPAFSPCWQPTYWRPAGDEGWWDKHKIWIGESNPPGVDASYSELLASSVFFFSLMGDGYSSRYDDAIIHG